MHLQDILIHLGHFLDGLHSSWEGLQLYEEVLGLPDTAGFSLSPSTHAHTRTHTHTHTHTRANSLSPISVD